ncbi:MAG TPA: hypothetical protein VLB84_02175 [Bacteroidia bacterium]|jgi:hypothetical protein|nr:hypothetical protein [Bacteroidia bacterium]
MKLILSVLTFVFLNASNCSSDSHFKEIKFGQGGGFTGAVTEYHLRENGDIYKYNAVEKEELLIKSITAEELKTVKEKLAKVPKESLNINHPYNVYYFIKIDTMNAVWGDPSFTIPKELEDLYNYLNATATKK